MRSVLALLIPIAASGIPAPALAERVYAGEKGATHDCAKEPEVVINAGPGTYTFTGPCTKLAINGNGNAVKADSIGKLLVNGSKNTVDVEATDKISVTGNENTINYKRGVTGKPKAASIGTNNKLNQVK